MSSCNYIYMTAITYTTVGSREIYCATLLELCKYSGPSVNRCNVHIKVAAGHAAETSPAIDTVASRHDISVTGSVRSLDRVAYCILGHALNCRQFEDWPDDSR